MREVVILPLAEKDRTWIADFITSRWGAAFIVAHGVVYEPRELAGFVAQSGNEIIGLVTYAIAGNACEIVTLDAVQKNIGIGTALIQAVIRAARQAQCQRVWLITTNDNLRALRFYQRRGFVLVAIHRNALEQARRIKPAIPLIGEDGIPLRDEIELEMPLGEISK